jgi:hypothetical protein
MTRRHVVAVAAVDDTTPSMCTAASSAAVPDNLLPSQRMPTTRCQQSTPTNRPTPQLLAITWSKPTRLLVAAADADADDTQLRAQLPGLRMPMTRRRHANNQPSARQHAVADADDDDTTGRLYYK